MKNPNTTSKLPYPLHVVVEFPRANDASSWYDIPTIKAIHFNNNSHLCSVPMCTSYVFDDMNDIVNDINLYRAFRIDENVMKTIEKTYSDKPEQLDVLRTIVRYMNAKQPLWVSADKVDEFKKNEPEGPVYLMLVAQKNIPGHIYGLPNTSGYPTFVYAVTNDILRARKALNAIIYDKTRERITNNSRGMLTPSISPETLLNACTDKNEPAESFDIYKYISQLELNPSNIAMTGSIADLYNIAREIVIININEKTANLPRYKKQFIYTPYFKENDCYIPSDISNAFIIRYESYLPFNPIINGKTGPAYLSIPGFGSEKYSIDDENNETDEGVTKDQYGNKLHRIGPVVVPESRWNAFGNPISFQPVYGCPVTPTNGIEAVKDPLIKTEMDRIQKDIDCWKTSFGLTDNDGVKPTESVESENKVTEVSIDVASNSGDEVNSYNEKIDNEDIAD